MGLEAPTALSSEEAQEAQLLASTDPDVGLGSGCTLPPAPASCSGPGLSVRDHRPVWCLTSPRDGASSKIV